MKTKILITGLVANAAATLPVIIVLAGVLALCGCEPCPHYNRLQVAAFYGPGKPLPRKLMSCEGTVGEEGGILKAMLYRAADMGADGIILNAHRISQETIAPNSQKMNINVTTGLIGEMIGNGNKRAYRAEAISFITTNAP